MGRRHHSARVNHPQKNKLIRSQPFFIFFALFFFPVGFAPGRGISAVGLTAIRPRSASFSESGMRMVSPGFGIFDPLALLSHQPSYGWLSRKVFGSDSIIAHHHLPHFTPNR